jgi:PadR family transcriptional regulator, regulatory protein PadR
MCWKSGSNAGRSMLDARRRHQVARSICATRSGSPIWSRTAGSTRRSSRPPPTAPKDKVFRCLRLARYLVFRYIMRVSDGAMTEPAFFVLTALAREPLHGYGILGEVAELSRDRVELKVGTLYGVLERLVTEGHVEFDHEEARQGRLRRYYRLTDAGRRELAADAARQAANSRAATSRLRAWRRGLEGRSG